MQTMVLFSPSAQENESMTKTVRHEAALKTEEEFSFLPFQRAAEAAQEMKKQDVNLISWDVSSGANRQELSGVRQDNRDAFLVVIAEPSTSPLEFLNPKIAPNSLVLRPVTEAERQRVAREMLDAVSAPTEKEAYFVIESREEQQRVSYDKIYYFEARSRKIFARLKGREIGFNGTLDQLAEALPPFFERCHRSFIVNTHKIEKVYLTENELGLADRLSVPLSRNFKKNFKG